MYLGLDLGTSNSVIAGFHDGKVQIFRPVDGGETLPSVIWIDKRGHRSYGRRAYDQSLIAPENAASGFKRLLGTSTPIDIKGAKVSLTPEECSVDIIKQLIAQAVNAVGSLDIERTVITTPAAFNQMQAEATLRAAQMAGLDNVSLLQEPVAAALAALAGNVKDGLFLIYDFGGGTFDVALAQAQDGAVSIINHQGVNMLGGRDFDRMIVQRIVRPWLEDNFDLPENFHRDPAYARLMRIAWLASERAKIDLSSLEETTILASEEEVRTSDREEEEIRLEIPLAREEFDDLIRAPIKQTVYIIRAMLEESNIKSDAVDRIVFIGGPSRIPLVREVVCNELAIKPDLSVDPMTAVACGAAWYAATMADKTPAISSVAANTERSEKQYLDATADKVTADKGVAANNDSPSGDETDDEPDKADGLSFDFPTKTTEDKIVLTMRVNEDLEGFGEVTLISDDWESEPLPMIDEMTIMVPLKKPGKNTFRVRVVNGNEEPCPEFNHSIHLIRVTPSVSNITAVHAIAIKARENDKATDNVLIPLVKRGDSLPESGEIMFRSAMLLNAGDAGSLSFELFQVEYPERIDLNLCIGLFNLEGRDLPEGTKVAIGDRVIFDWQMSESGILRASVRLPDSDVQLKVPRFYAPQAGQVSFHEVTGEPFARAVISRGYEELGDLTAALGPDAGADSALLKTRLDEQNELLRDNTSDPETLRRIVEETRFIRQDIARLTKKHAAPMLQRRLGKIQAVFNRIARAHAQAQELEQFEQISQDIQAAIDSNRPDAIKSAYDNLVALRSLFFTCAWRNNEYARNWFSRLSGEPWLFPDKSEFDNLVKEGKALIANNDDSGLRNLVGKMLDARIAMGASDAAAEPAAIVKA